MAKNGFDVDFDGSFKRALLKLAAQSKMTSAQIVNQTLLDIAEKSFDLTPLAKGAATAQDSREAVRADIRSVIADRQYAGQTTSAGTPMLAQTKAEGIAGKTTKAGKFIRHKMARQLIALNLIVNKLRKNSGKKGLYGKDMMRYTASVSRGRTGGSGSVRIAFLPAMRLLMPFAKFKFSWSAKAKGIKRWPGSQGWGKASPAKAGTSPEAEFSVSRFPRRTFPMRQNQDPKITAMLKAAISGAIAWKREKVIKKAEQIMQPAIDEFNRR